MMSAAEGLAKARDVAAAGECITDPKVRLEWDNMAREWMLLAIMAETRELRRRELLDRSPQGDTTH
jgi:hypothetical protein